MKYFFVCLLFLAARVTAQDSLKVPADTIIFKSQIRLKVKVTLIEPERVQYKKINNLNGPVYSSPVADIRRIHFANGAWENIDSIYAVRQGIGKKYGLTNGLSAEAKEMYDRGMKDAKEHYTHRGGAVGTGITSFFFGPFGLIPAIICSSTPPKDEDLGYPDKTLWENRYYQDGYRGRAWKMRVARVWSGFGVGLGSSIVVSLMILPKG
jgi:hypothetical protein